GDFSGRAAVFRGRQFSREGERGWPAPCPPSRLVSACAHLGPLQPFLRGAAPWGRYRNSMSKGDLLEMEGVIQDALGGGQYTIKVDQGGAVVRAQLSGRMRRHHIRVLPGDRVRVAVSPYDLSHGLIVYRGRS